MGVLSVGGSQGYDITGVFMRNWDASDEAGDDHQCPISQASGQ